MDQLPRNLADRTDDAFWPRLRRATVMLLAAVAVHTWLVRTPDGAGTVRLVPAVSTEAVAGGEAAAGGDGEAGQPASPADRKKGVRVGVRIIEVPVVKPPEPPSPTKAASGVEAEPATAMGRLPVSDPAPLSGRAGAGPAVAVSTNGVSDPAVADMELVRTPPAGAFDARPVETVLAALPPLEPPADRERMRSPAPPDGRTAFAAAEAARPRSRGAAELKQQEALVLALLQEYTRAYERMDVQAAKAVWPTLDTRALQRAFQQLEAQRVRFARCQIDFMSQHEANAHCRGDYAFTPRVGNRREQLVPREWTFNLAQAEDRWRIVDVNAAYH